MKRNNPAQTPPRPNAGAATSMNIEEISPTNAWVAESIINIVES